MTHQIAGNMPNEKWRKIEAALRIIKVCSFLLSVYQCIHSSRGVHLLIETLRTCWAKRIWMLRISTLCFFVNPKFPDFQIPRNLAQAKLGPGWAGLGPWAGLAPGGPLGWAGGPRVGRGALGWAGGPSWVGLSGGPLGWALGPWKQMSKILIVSY